MSFLVTLVWDLEYLYGALVFLDGGMKWRLCSFFDRG